MVGYIRSTFKKFLHNTNYANDFHVLRTMFRRNQKIIDIQSSWEKVPVKKKGLDFFNWFDSVSSFEEIGKGAIRDFNYAVERHIELNPEDTILEIGCGGGRLASVACKKTKKYLGVDIHENFEATTNFLHSCGCRNFSLYNFSELNKIPTFDLAYSFIVIQHFKSIEVFESYLDFLADKLSIGGYAVLWYAKLNRMLGAYYEVPSLKFRERECSLYISKAKMEQLVIGKNFHIQKHIIHNFTPDYRRKSGQSLIVIKKVKSL